MDLRVVKDTTTFDGKVTNHGVFVLQHNKTGTEMRGAQVDVYYALRQMRSSYPRLLVRVPWCKSLPSSTQEDSKGKQTERCSGPPTTIGSTEPAGDCINIQHTSVSERVLTR